MHVRIAVVVVLFSILTACGGGGGGNVATTMEPPTIEPDDPNPPPQEPDDQAPPPADPRPAERLPFPLPDVACDGLCQYSNGNTVADEHHGIYAPANAVLSLQHLPVYTSGQYLRVGVDQGRAIASLPTVGTRTDMDIRHGRVADGAGQANVQSYLDDAAGERWHSAPALIRMVGSPDERQRNWIEAAVRAVNAALPPDARMRLGPVLPADYDSLNEDGIIAVKFVPAGSLGGNTAGRTPSRTSRSATGEITGSASIILLDRGANVFSPNDLGGDRRAVILIAHELLHALGIGHVSPAFDTIIANNADMYLLRQGRQQPASLLYPVDREALRVLYGGSDPTEFGPWSAISTHLHGNGAHAAFGVARRNGYAEPYAYGLSPDGNLADNRALSGQATWEGTLVGFTPAAAAVMGNADIAVQLAALTGRANFTELESWAVSAAPGEAGTGTMWGDGDLSYTIAVHGNTFRETGGDNGRLTGIFTGREHEGAAGTLERSDLTAAFGATR